MECNRCCLQPVIHAFTQSNLENSLGRMKTKEIIAAVNNLKGVFRNLCGKCQSLPSQTNERIEELKAAWNEKFTAVAESVVKDKENMKPLIAELQQAFQAVCLTCAKVSNDDNPSNHGQTFVSLDSGNCQADSGRAKTTHTDDNIVQSRADWIGLHKAPDWHSHSYGMSPQANLAMKEDPEYKDKIMNATTTVLPLEVEDRLRKEFSNFVELDIIDKILLACVMSGMNIAEFAKMLWFPYSLVDPKTRMVKSITKQAAHARWINICRRFPVFMSIAVSSKKDSKKSIERLRKFVEDPNADAPTNRFQNGKMTAEAAKAARKAKEAIDTEEQERAERHMLEKLRMKYGEPEKRTTSRRRKGDSTVDTEILLPGLF